MDIFKVITTILLVAGLGTFGYLLIAYWIGRYVRRQPTLVLRPVSRRERTFDRHDDVEPHVRVAGPALLQAHQLPGYAAFHLPEHFVEWPHAAPAHADEAAYISHRETVVS